MSKKIVYALVGPSCTFKSKIAIDLAKEFPFEIISADSRLIYRGMDIGTSKPTIKDRENVPHFMIDIIQPNDDYSVALYKRESEKVIKDIFNRGKIPLFVGGTGLYLNAVLLGLSIPEIKPDISFRRQLKNIPQEELYTRLNNLDPKACETIHKNDNFRTIRALEVIYKTNKLFSNLKSSHEPSFKIIWIGLTYKNKELHKEKIQRRTKHFCDNGFIKEVSKLVKTYGELDLFLNTIGYKEGIDYLKGLITKDELIEYTALHTRQYVKRQTTWFRANKKINWIYLDDISYKDALDKALSLVSDGSLANTSMVSMS